MSVVGIGKKGLGAVGAAALVALLSACGSGSSSTATGGSASGATQGKAPVTVSAKGLKTMSTSIGTVLVDASNHTVYELVGDSAASDTCTGSCLAIWPPLLKNGRPVIVNGHPAFTYVKDTAPGQTTGQNVTDQWGRWLALDAQGNPITAPGSATSPSASPSKSSAPNGGTAAF